MPEPRAAPRAEPSEPEAVGDLAIVLHSHMPYVEGFGTYPFGEEWLFEAVASSYLPVLEHADHLTMSVTPVLADQLEADGVGERMLDWLRRYRVGTAELDAARAGGRLGAAAAFQGARYGLAVERLECLGGDALRPFQAAAASGRIELIASAATHAVLPKLATREGCRLQLDAGLRSHRRRFGRPLGFWLPECAYAPGLEGMLAERDLRYTCLDQSGEEPDGAALVPARLPGGPVALTIDWPTVELVWSSRGYPSHPGYLDHHRLSENGSRLWAIGGEPYDPAAARERALADGEAFLAGVRERLAAFRKRRGREGLCVFAVDTELLGHHWAEGPVWLSAVLEGAPAAGVRLLTLERAVAAHEPEERPVREASWGEGKTLETWDSPAVADLAWAARRLELRLLRLVAERGFPPGAAERAARELLAVQSSDWAFLDHRGSAGDYPFDRAVAHAEAMLEAIDSPRSLSPRMRNLAPDLSLAPLLEP
jgi:1,4-alpha-glucan branching enzyme